MTPRRDLAAFPLLIMRDKAWREAGGNEMGAWFSQEPGMGMLEESQQDAAAVQG